MKKVKSDNLIEQRGLHYDWLSVGLVFVIILSASLLWNVSVYYFDSSYYWNIANTMMGQNGFSFLGFPETFRGYFYPFLLLMLKGLGILLFNKENILFMVVNSALIALLIGKVIPIILDVKITAKRQIIGSALFAAIICVFWKGAITYPLSDLPAMAMFMTALALMQSATKINIENERRIKSVCKFLIFSFFSGLLLYAAYNTRAVYQFPAILAILFFLNLNKNKRKKYLITFTIVALLGAALIALPQAKINEKYTGKFTPRVMTEQLFNYNNDLIISQLYWGIYMQRYETYVGNSDAHYIPNVKYIDETGNKILQHENIDLNTFSIGTLLKLYLKYPMDFAGIYTRHIFSYITNITYDVFVEEFYHDSSLKFVVNAFIWFFGILGLIVAEANKRSSWLKKNWTYIFCLLLPCILIIPGAPEIRFFIALYFLLYGYLCYQVNLEIIKSIIKKKPIVIVDSFLIVLLVWFAVMGAILASVDKATMLINNKPWILKDNIKIIKTVSTAKGIVADQIDNVNVWGTNLDIAADEYYYFSFETNAKAADVKLFYLDLYDATKYDRAEQDKHITLNRKDNKYSGVIYTGTDVPNEAVQLRLVTIPNKKIEIDNLVVQRCEMKK